MDSDVQMEVPQCEEGPTESHEVEIWQEPNMSFEPQQQEEAIYLPGTPRQPEPQPEAAVAAPEAAVAAPEAAVAAPEAAVAAPEAAVAAPEAAFEAPANQEQQQPGTSAAATQGRPAAMRKHPPPGHRVKIPKFLNRVKGHMWFGNSLPPNLDLEDETTRDNLRLRFYGEMRKLKIEWSKSAVMVNETKGTTVDGDIKSMTFTVGLRVDRRKTFVDYELGTITVTTRPGDGSQFVFNILNRDQSKKIGLSVAAMVRASKVVFGIKLVKSSKAMDLLTDSSDSDSE